MNNEDLQKLRELFRARFREHDFCIGEQQVEDFFRELLGEPEPERADYYNEIKSNITSQQLSDIMSNIMSKSVEDIFNQNDTFFKNIAKR